MLVVLLAIAAAVFPSALAADADCAAAFDDDSSLLQVSLLQTGLQTTRRDVDPSPGSGRAPLNWALEAAETVLLTSPAEVVAAAAHEAGLHGKAAPPPKAAGAKGSDLSWLDYATDKLAVKSWEMRQWLYFAICLVVREAVVWKAFSKGREAKDWHKKWRVSNPAAQPPRPPKRLALTVPLRNLLDQSVGSVKLSRSADGLAFVATLLENASGERTVQLADAAAPMQALMSVGPLPQSGLLEDGAAVYRHTTGYTLGSLKSHGPGSWSLSKDGQTNICISSTAPFTLAMTVRDREVAWVKPLSETKEPDYVDLSFCEDGDPLLRVACALAVLVASSSSSQREA